MKFSKHELEVFEYKSKIGEITKKSYTEYHRKAKSLGIDGTTFSSRWSKFKEGLIREEDLLAPVNNHLIQNTHQLPVENTKLKNEFKEAMEGMGYAKSTINKRWANFRKGLIDREDLFHPNNPPKEKAYCKEGSHRYRYRTKAMELGILISTFNLRYRQFLAGEILENEILSMRRLHSNIKQQNFKYILIKFKQQIYNKFGRAPEEMVLILSLLGVPIRRMADIIGVKSHHIEYARKVLGINRMEMQILRRRHNIDIHNHPYTETEDD